VSTQGPHIPVTFSDELEQQAQSTVNLLLKKYSRPELLALSGVEEEKEAATKPLFNPDRTSVAY
jgi:hypothetical protein